MGHGGDAAHALEDVEHEALGLQKALLLALHRHHNITRFHMGAILNIHFYFHRGVEAAEHFLSYLHAGKDALFLDKEFALAIGISRDAAECCVVAIANVFCKGKVYESIV